MRREPSINILESDFIKVLESVLPDENATKLARVILIKSKRYSLPSRMLVIGNQAQKKIATKVLASSTNDCMLMAKIIYFVRKDLKHRGITMAKAGTRDWSLIKDIAATAIDFCNEFGLQKEEGFKEYILTAIKKMNKFGLNKVAGMYQGICEDYEAVSLIRQDPHPELTSDAYQEYNNQVYNKLGSILVNYSEIPNKFVYFIKVAVKAAELNIPPSLYIKAQFKGLEWAESMPDPAQLVGDKALERLQKYMYENKNLIKEATTVNTKKLNTLLKLKNGK